jgi:hypothetical protein
MALAADYLGDYFAVFASAYHYGPAKALVRVAYHHYAGMPEGGDEALFFHEAAHTIGVCIVNVAGGADCVNSRLAQNPHSPPF